MILSTIPYPTVDGVRVSFVSLEVKVAGQIIPMVALDYDRERKREMVRVNHSDPAGKTRGENDYTTEGEWLLAEWTYLQNLLQARGQSLNGNPNRAGYGDVFFTIDAVYSERGFDLVHDVILGCTLDSATNSAKTGAAGLTRKSKLNPVKILYNGLDDCATPLVAPPGM